jgi:1,4-alpha-glucan branching enzyme
MNSVVKAECPGFLTIAEESTAWPGVTGPVGDAHLGFSFKWDMGWMHDFCEYMKLDPIYRKSHHYDLTFAMTYNESEKYILPLSHDEVVHLKCSMVNKMPGYPMDKYANLRVGYAYMFGHSGKKLLFMGQEFGQEREWSEARELDWFLLAERSNQGMQEYMKELLRIYRKYPAFYVNADSWIGFEWMNADDTDSSVYSFVRKSPTGRNHLLFVLNMTPVKREGYRVGVPANKKFRLLLNSDEERFGGWGNQISEEIMAEAVACHYRDYSISIDLPPYGAAVFLF